MTEQPIATFEGLLRRYPAFHDLGDDRLQWLAARSRPFHCTVGQELLRYDRIPEYCFCVVEGRGRLLHDDPGLRRPVTLAYSQPGDLIGWSGLVRRTPCEWVTAAIRLIDTKRKASTNWSANQSLSAAGLMLIIHTLS